MKTKANGSGAAKELAADAAAATEKFPAQCRRQPVGHGVVRAARFDAVDTDPAGLARDASRGADIHLLRMAARGDLVEEHLAEEGARITICSRTQADLEQAAEAIRSGLSRIASVCSIAAR